MQKFLNNNFRQSSEQIKNKYNCFDTDPCTINELETLIKLRNYYRRKFQHTRNHRCKIFRNILNNIIKNNNIVKIIIISLNNIIKNKVIDIKNKNWFDKLKMTNIKNNSLWRTLISMKGKRYRLHHLNNQTIIYNPKDKSQALAEFSFSFHRNKQTQFIP